MVVLTLDNRGNSEAHAQINACAPPGLLGPRGMAGLGAARRRPVAQKREGARGKGGVGVLLVALRVRQLAARCLLGRPILYTTQRGRCMEAFVSILAHSQSQKLIPGGGGVQNLSCHLQHPPTD